MWGSPSETSTQTRGTAYHSSAGTSRARVSGTYSSRGVNGRGSTEHQYWQERLASQLMGLGWQVEKEYPIGGGKAIDLVAAKNGRRIAFEVETGHSDIAANVRKIPRGLFDKLVVVLTSGRARPKARRLERSGLKVVKATDLEGSLAKNKRMPGGQKSEM